MINLSPSNHLSLDRCPHCSIADPTLSLFQHVAKQGKRSNQSFHWWFFFCESCGCPVCSATQENHKQVLKLFPKPTTIEKDIPDIPGEYLRQAHETFHAPSGSILLSGSAIDAMLKEHKYSSGSLFSRIEQAAKDGVITAGMKDWAHEVRLEANDQRHADENAGLPTDDDAKRTFEFANTLAFILYVLPARIQKGVGGGSSSIQNSP